MRWSRRVELPAEARSALPLQRRERVLAAARLTDGSWAAATPNALVFGGRRLDWVSTAYAEWDDESATLRVDELRTGDPGEPADSRPTTHRIPLEEPGLLPEVVRERVTASIVVSRHTVVQGRHGLRAVARRMPGSDDLVWQVVLDRGLDPGDPKVRAASETALRDLRRELGE